MKKFLLLIVLYSSISFSQENKFKVESMIDISISPNGRDTTFYKFNNGKLISQIKKGNAPTYFKYNEKGLLENEYYISSDGEVSETTYKYNEDGLIIEIYHSRKANQTAESIPWSKETISFDFKANNDYAISKVFTTLTYKSDDNFITYTKEGNTLNILTKQGKNTKEYSHKIENGNIIFTEKLKPSKENYSMEFKFDNKINLFKIIYSNIFGDKYFINDLLTHTPVNNLYDDFIDENNCMSVKNIKTTKYVSNSEKTTTINYDIKNLPIEIKVESDPGYGNLIKVTYQK